MLLKHNPARWPPPCRSVSRTLRRTRALHTTAALGSSPTRPNASQDRERFDPRAIERAEDDVDVCIVGAGPAGLSAAIRLKQLEKERGDGREIRVVILEKASEVGKSNGRLFPAYHLKKTCFFLNLLL
jgi:electron-transferring-flavoprotein dehydrogenase